MKVLNRIEGDGKAPLRETSTIELYKYSRKILAGFAILLPGTVFFLGSLVMKEYVISGIAVLFSLSGFFLSKWLIDRKAEKLKTKQTSDTDTSGVIRFPSSNTGSMAKFKS
jgi:hypothetical protein